MKYLTFKSKIIHCSILANFLYVIEKSLIFIKPNMESIIIGKVSSGDILNVLDQTNY